MPLPRFIQIHTLHTYPAALLNRDDAGLAKRLPLGDAVRTRISSQCLKRHWRDVDDHFSISKLGFQLEERSTYFLNSIRDRLELADISAELAQAAVEGLCDGLGLNQDKKKKDKFKTSEVLLLGVSEVNFLTDFCLEIAKIHGDKKALAEAIKEKIAQKPSKGEKSFKDNLKVMMEQCGLVSALFGRMITSDALADRDASIFVSHSFTVHKAQVENDYFTVVDDLMREAGDLGSAGIFDTELASGLYYGYVVVDVPQLVENLEAIAAKDCFADSTPTERRELAGRVVEHLLHLIATVSPGAKRGSTAPFDWAKFMLVEAGDWQPRSLAGAFHDALPLEVKGNTDTIRQRAVTRITQEISAMDEAYGAPLARRFLALDAVEIAGAERANLTKLGEWASAIVRQGAC